MVSYLIDFPARRWKEDVLNDLFVPSDIEFLLKNQPAVLKEDFFFCLEAD